MNQKWGTERHKNELMTKTVTSVGDYVSVAEAAERLGITDSAIRRAISRGYIDAVKFGKFIWLVKVDDVAAYYERERKLGRPFSEAKRCLCGAHTLTRAKSRAYDCCKAAGLMERTRKRAS